MRSETKGYVENERVRRGFRMMDFFLSIAVAMENSLLYEILLCGFSLLLLY